MHVLVTREMMLPQEPFQVLEQMLVAGTKIGTTSEMVKYLLTKQLQQLFCAQRYMRASVVVEQSPSDCHLFQHQKKYMGKQLLPGYDDIQTDGCHRLVRSPATNIFQTGLQKLVSRYETCLNSSQRRHQGPPVNAVPAKGRPTDMPPAASTPDGGVTDITDSPVGDTSTAVLNCLVNNVGPFVDDTKGALKVFASFFKDYPVQEAPIKLVLNALRIASGKDKKAVQAAVMNGLMQGLAALEKI
ncbi:hypothetical protein AVEN_163633-1 [Araneus ventricosus]|uniref:Uncharacterized protein n=2 Tax=Araneus ventricosus TaxID=182803 RepID=A0A4Y2IW76_ARAVE|nr:hypothetical protein AVEN_163633-1 [Araneus ventricosus]